MSRRRRLLGQIDYDGYFLEYDSERAGGFEPLRFLPKGQAGRARPDHLQERHAGGQGRHQDAHRRSAKFAPLEQFCLSPQCGFASTEEGNILTEDQQWAKMREIVELADEVWGK
jgi:5-methyltetrahydropteroyltriglutamate--homocysteine methyltransferase